MFMALAATFDGGREKAPAAISRKLLKPVSAVRKRLVIWEMGFRQEVLCTLMIVSKGIQAIMYSNIEETD